MGRTLFDERAGGLKGGYEVCEFELREWGNGLAYSQARGLSPVFGYHLWMVMQHLNLGNTEVAEMTNAVIHRLHPSVVKGQRIKDITVWTYKKGWATPKSDNRVAMCIALGVDELWLCGHVPTQNQQWIKGFTLDENDYPYEEYVNEVHPCPKPKYEKKAAYKFEPRIVNDHVDINSAKNLDGGNIFIMAYATSLRRVQSYKETVSQVTLHQRIKYCRLLCGMSREELSRRMTILKRPISVDYIAALEGDSEVLAICDKWTLNKIARCMKVPVDFLTGQKIIDVEDDPEFKDAA